MRIGIDARELGPRSTGVGTYLRGLLDQWAGDQRARQHEFVLYAPHAFDLPGRTDHFITRIVDGSTGVWWEQMQLARAASADRLNVFFGPAYSTALRLRVPTVVAIHDLSFFAHPEWFRLREGMRRRWFTRRSAERASSIVTISDFTRGELVNRLGVRESSIHVIPPGITSEARGWGLEAGQSSEAGGSGLEARGPSEDSGLPPARGPYNVLFVGSIFNRRHIVDLIRAFGRLSRAHPDVSLDIVGDNRSYPFVDVRRAIAAEALEGRVRWHEYAPDATLRDLYLHARAFAFLSEYEGLGLTPLEALAAGVPSVLLDTPVARESCGDAALYVPLNDLPATTRALELLLFDEPTRARLLAAAPRVLGRYEWSRAGRETLAVIEAAATRKV
jgi:glycosyltransferase involved in cell wall biosynthesis